MVDVSISKAIDGFLLTKEVAGCSPSTIRNYRLAITRFIEFLAPANPNIRDIDTGHIIKFVYHLQTAQFTHNGAVPRTETLSNKTVKNTHTALSSLWTWAIKQGYADEHIPKKVDVPDPDPPEIVPFTKYEVRDILDATQYQATQNGHGHRRRTKRLRLRDKALILFLLDTGVRASECCRLTIANVDLKAGAARVIGKSRRNSGKGKERSVYFGDRCRKALWEFSTIRDTIKSDPVFPVRSGNHFDRRNLGQHISRLGDRAGVEDCYPHRFRHTYAINYLRNGGDIYTLQRSLGHTSLDMCRRYLKIAEADLEQAHRRASPVDNWRL